MNTTQTNGFLASLLICAFLAITPTYAVDVLFVGGQPNAVQGADPRVLEILQEHFGAENITVVGANQATTDDADAEGGLAGPRISATSSRKVPRRG